VSPHVEEEETELFPKVRDALTIQQLENLGEALAADKDERTNPPPSRMPILRPHALFGLPSAVLDRAVRPQGSGGARPEARS